MPMPQPSAKLYRGRVADQIVEDLGGQILSGALPDGARLPSERELATHYDVSGPTIREAIRALTAMGLLSTRNGSRTTVTARSDTLLAMSIASVVQFEKMTAADVFGVLGELNAYAVEQAVERATEEDIAGLRRRRRAGGQDRRRGVGRRRNPALLRDPVRDLAQPAARRPVPIDHGDPDRNRRQALRGERRGLATGRGIAAPGADGHRGRHCPAGFRSRRPTRPRLPPQGHQTHPVLAQGQGTQGNRPGARHDAVRLAGGERGRRQRARPEGLRAPSAEDGGSSGPDLSTRLNRRRSQTVGTVPPSMTYYRLIKIM